MEPTILNLSNDEYHNSETYAAWISSSQLKLYQKSPRYAKYKMEHPEPQTEAMRFGSLCHSAMETFAKYHADPDTALAEWLKALAVFTPPVNKATGNPYGTSTKAYAEAYQDFLSANLDKEIVSLDDIYKVEAMVGVLVDGVTETSRQVLRLLKMKSMKSEVSHFTEIGGVKVKCRCDMETDYGIWDFKFLTLEDFSDESLTRAVIKYGYDVSAAFYQAVVHEVTGVWKPFYLIIVSKSEPYDAIIADLSQFAYQYVESLDMVQKGPGALEFERLLALHGQCLAADEWPGAESFITESDREQTGAAIKPLAPPSWYLKKMDPEYI